MLFLVSLAGAGLSFGQLSVAVENDTVRIWDTNFEFGCGATFFPVFSISQDTLYLAECDTAFHLPCRCIYTLCTSISGFAPGTYTAVVTREIRKYFYNPDSIYSHVFPAGSVSFVVSQHSLPSLTFYQSPCGGVVGVESSGLSNLPVKPELSAFPNPFNPSTTIEYTLPGMSSVRLEVFNTFGQRVATVAEGERAAGHHQVVFDGARLASGVYLLRLQVRLLDFPPSGSAPRIPPRGGFQEREIPPNAGFGKGGTAIGRDSESGAEDFVATRKVVLLH